MIPYSFCYLYHANGMQISKSSEEKLSQLNLIPRHFPDTKVDIHAKEAAAQPIESASEVRLRNRAVYKADLRKQLLGEEAKRREGTSDDLMKHEEKQESLANELLSLTRSLKQNMSVAGNVLKDDNKRLSSMNAQVDANVSDLRVESTRLAHHAYKCGFDCALVFVALFIFWSFICMVVVMKKKKGRLAAMKGAYYLNEGLLSRLPPEFILACTPGLFKMAPNALTWTKLESKCPQSLEPYIEASLGWSLGDC
ncbi:unnamed protein product [Cylicocyclus nassatus]|uniref:Vesicle transport protein USE1 n=1 Tax=Cylicocyclus nassatus TaxID=53992 RepID=A0AA36GLU6_CYLNA|nr:unnamed protein product [Cylicocyclus nassatus]